MKSIQSILNVNGEGHKIEVECTLTNGLPSIIIIGLGNKSIEESKERIRSAFHCCKLEFPKKRITINLAPADIPKESTSFDLAIAVAILLEQKNPQRMPEDSAAFIGEIGLDGSIRSIRGIIGKIIAGKKLGIATFFIPHGNLRQATLIPDITVIPFRSLSEVHTYLFTKDPIPSNSQSVEITNSNKSQDAKLSEVVGQYNAKRALQIAAAGGHNILLNGPPGAGKSMLAKALPSLLPPMSTDEMLEVTHLHSLASNNYEDLICDRPFRTPHHTASRIAIIGGGQVLKPGEISLSHRGVLFLDEMPEFDRSTLESLRQPLEDRIIAISRAKETALFPADFILVATANPCPCGFYGSTQECQCTMAQLQRYRQKISGPILDRIDLHVTVDTVDHGSLLQPATNDDLRTIIEAISRARSIQQGRFKSFQRLNASMTNKELRAFCNFDVGSKVFLDVAAKKLSLSARSYMKVAKTARTIADLEDSEAIKIAHISEALQYRNSNNAHDVQGSA
jgi:magnesium chelatase family protein